jgi:isopentenyldiphosphate isomerase
MEEVDILTPPTFEKSGVIKSRKLAIRDGDWIGTFNLWIIQSQPTPSIIYQQRSANSRWAPNKLDVTAGGHYKAGETIYDGLREVHEELGKDYQKDELTYHGRKLNISPNIHGEMTHTVVDIFFVTDNSPLDKFILEKNEVYAIAACPINELLKVHTEQNYSFSVESITNEGQTKEITITKDSFPYNWDNYHFKIALLAERYLNEGNNLIY